MLNVKDALAAASVPGYRGAFRPRSGQMEPPALYCVYSYTRTPGWASDDSDRAVFVRAFLHLFAQGDPEDALRRIQTEMKRQGFALIRETEGYVAESGRYEVAGEWQGVRA